MDECKSIRPSSGFAARSEGRRSSLAGVCLAERNALYGRANRVEWVNFMATFSRVLMVHPALQLNDLEISHVSTATPTPTPTLSPTAGSIWQNRMIALRSPVLASLWLQLPEPRSAFSLPTLISPTATPNDQTL